MLDASEEHRRAFKEQPLVVFRRAPNLKDSFVRAKLPMSETGITKGCFKCGKSHCQVCSFISESSSFSGNVSGKQYSLSSSFNCESSGSVYLLGCKACGRQYVGSTFTSLRTRFNNYAKCPLSCNQVSKFSAKAVDRRLSTHLLKRKPLFSLSLILL